MRPTLRYAYSRNGEHGRVDEKCLVRVQIPTVDSGDNGKVRYHVRITNVRSGQMWQVAHRFSEFLQLRNALLAFFAATDKKCPGCRNYEKVLQLFEFPRKHVFTSVTPAVINYRKKALCSFTALLASHTFTTTPKCPTCSSFPFTGVRDWLTMDTGTRTGEAGANTVTSGSSTNESIRDTMNVKDFTKYHPVTTSMSVDQEGRFVGNTGRKFVSPVASFTDETESQRSVSSPLRCRGKQLVSREHSLESHSRYNDSESLKRCTQGPPSPPSVDDFSVLAPAAVVDTRMKVDSDNDMERDGDVDDDGGNEGDEDDEEEDDDDEGFESFVTPSSAALDASGDCGTMDHCAREPPIRDGDLGAPKETVRKTQFKFTRNSMWADGEQSSLPSRGSSMIDINGLGNEEEEEGLNMDFMEFANTAPTSVEGPSCTL